MAFIPRVMVAGISAGLFLALTGLAVEPEPADALFSQEVARNSKFEIQTGEIAGLRSPSEQVRQYGHRMVGDYTDLEDQLKSIAARDNLALPDTMGENNQSTMDLLIEISGPAPLALPAFDQVYIGEIIGAHEMDIAAFRKESTGGLNPDLRSWAASALPILQEQLSLAKNARNYLGSVSQVVKSNKCAQWSANCSI